MSNATNTVWWPVKAISLSRQFRELEFSLSDLLSLFCHHEGYGLVRCFNLPLAIYNGFQANLKGLGRIDNNLAKHCLCN